jgi:hypothetical protein
MRKEVVYMNSPRVGFNLRAVVAAFVISSVPSPAQTGNVIDVTDSRPLAGAIDVLERFVGVPINYEDPPYQNQADLQDVSTPQQRTAQPGFQLIVPRVGNVTAETGQPSVGPATESDALFDLNLLLANYRQNALPGEFKTEQANGMLYVTPIKVLGAGGSTLDVISPMTVSVTVSDAKRSVAEAAQTILDAVYKATGQRIVIGTFPFWPTDMVDFSATGVPARDALAKLFSQTGKGVFSYRLLFDPKPDPMRLSDYMINVKVAGYVNPLAPQGLAPIKVSSNPVTTLSSGDGNPAFVKAK